MSVVNPPSSKAKIKPRVATSQPLHAAQISSALLKLKTLQDLSGLGKTSIYQRIKAGELKVIRLGKRCTRVRGEEAQRFLQALASEVAE